MLPQQQYDHIKFSKIQRGLESHEQNFLNILPNVVSYPAY